ncbi:MAG: magnesium protoporphyrin IX methyltransferase, partial [Chloroflexota bacterium]
MSNADLATQHRAQLQSYFNGVGFDRWSAIYGSGPVSRVRRTVREGHQMMLNKATTWLDDMPTDATVLDAGCGTGLFSLEMARRGHPVTAADIAPRMVQATETAATAAGLDIHCYTSDIESLTGNHDIVACFDVLVHYPSHTFVPVLQHLAQRTTDTLLITYAPYNRFFAFLHWVGGHFPKGERRTEIQMIRDEVVASTLSAEGL